MITLYVHPTRFECQTAQEAATLAVLIGATNAPIGVRPGRVGTRKHPAATLEEARARQGRMQPTGKKKTCKTCRAEFPIEDRTDCAAVHCRGCRPKPAPRRRGPRHSIPRPKPRAANLALPERQCEAKGCIATFAPERPDIVHCHAHRLGPGQNRGSAGRPVVVRPVPAGGQPSAGEPLGLPMGTCSTCGASVPVFELQDGECLECAPLVRRKAS